jgi:hypothetical protein
MGLVRRFALVALAVSAVSGLAAISAGAEEVTGTSCASNTGSAKFSPGIGEAAQVQNISVKGALTECTGSAGPKATYVVQLKTTTAITCASVRDELTTAQGSIVVKWGHGHGNSLGNLTVSGSVESGFSLSGTVTQGPYAGGSISGTVSGVAQFTGKGEPCTKKNRLKTMTISGTSPLTIS